MVTDFIVDTDWESVGNSISNWWDSIFSTKSKPTTLPPGVIGQGKEKGNRSRNNINWLDNRNSRRPKKRKKHTPGRGHNHHLLWLLLPEYIRKLLGYEDENEF